MTSAKVLTIATLGAAALGAGVYFKKRGGAPIARTNSSVLTVITPVIDLGVAELVLSALDQVAGDDVTLLLHTQGGCVASCVMIAKALRHFPNSTAVVPFMAISGGTLIALSARNLQMGRGAYLSAVDPIVFGERAKYLTAGPAGSPDSADARLAGLARDYELAITRFMRTTLTARLRDTAGASVDAALEVFMGRDTPHEWPIPMTDVLALGIPVAPAARHWSALVDSRRRAW
jgi:membrane-bound ClpP family serine protease